MKRIGLLVEKDDGYNYEEVFPLLTGFIGLCLALLPIEEEVTGEIEGECTVVQANRYERSRINRAACIQAHGSTCTVCGFDFGKFYGISGQGFIEVHHVKPVSQMGKAYRLNPETDLIPVCSNCHSMIHHQNPPLSIEQLREMIKSNGHR